MGAVGRKSRPFKANASVQDEDLYIHIYNQVFGFKHKGPPGGASGPFAFKSRLLSRDATGGGSSRPEALDNYDINLRPRSCGSTNFATAFGTKIVESQDL